MLINNAVDAIMVFVISLTDPQAKHTKAQHVEKRRCSATNHGSCAQSQCREGRGEGGGNGVTSRLAKRSTPRQLSIACDGDAGYSPKPRTEKQHGSFNIPTTAATCHILMSNVAQRVPGSDRMLRSNAV